MKRFFKQVAPAFKVLLLVTLFLAASYNQYVNTARAYDNGSYDYCDWYPEDPQCGGDPCSSANPPPECTTFCEQYPADPTCVDNPCFSDNPPSDCACSGAFGPPPPECFDPCSGEMGPPPPECFDPCLQSNPPSYCSDPCESDNPPSHCINYYCDDGAYCSEFEDPVPCNYDPGGSNAADPKQGDSSTCDCSCKEDRYFCDDPVYCDGDEPRNYEPARRGQPGWEADNTTCDCDPKYFCDDPTYCDGEPACNYQPEKRGVNPWVADNSLCTCQDYCPEPDDPNYVDPATLRCPRADYGLCSIVYGCKDSTAFNYDADADEHDQEMCLYLKTTLCSYEVTFDIDKLNSLTGNIRNYAVGVLQVVIVSYLSPDPDAPNPGCPTLDPVQFTAAHYSFIYDFLFPSWPSFNYESTSYTNLGETEDFCANLEGIQDEVPAGYSKIGDDCIPDVFCVEQGCKIVGEECVCTDMCPNIAGNQTEIPPGYYLDEAGNCVTDPECSSNGCSVTGGICRCPVDGNCAVYVPDPSGPEPSGFLCTEGDPSEITYSSSSWNYSCLGLWGGSDDQCSVGVLCPDQKYCATNPTENQCIDSNACCEGFVKCPNGQCRPGTIANCVDVDLECDETVSPPLCSRDGIGGEIIGGMRMTPPVSDIDTNSCVISWGIDTQNGSVSCALTRDGAAVQSYGPATTDTNYDREVEPGRYEVTCNRTSTEVATDSEGVESTYTLRVEERQIMSCVQNPNYVEF